ncbi:hypothetical protein [uncultured Zhongshania sp.]|uniref:hypothetical protein n=1 Tax=uncultured Zhongshania sp. TaxID=1642288 RepID=UPI0030DB0AC9
MMPFATYQGTTDDDGKFLKLETPKERRARYRVNMWVETNNGGRLTDDYTAKKPCALNDLLQQTILPAVDELIEEAKEHGGTKRYGFSCFKWG